MRNGIKTSGIKTNKNEWYKERKFAFVRKKRICYNKHSKFAAGVVGGGSLTVGPEHCGKDKWKSLKEEYHGEDEKGHSVG